MGIAEVAETRAHAVVLSKSSIQWNGLKRFIMSDAVNSNNKKKTEKEQSSFYDNCTHNP